MERIHALHALVLQVGRRQGDEGQVQIEDEFPLILTWSRKLHLPSRNTRLELGPQFRDLLLHLEAGQVSSYFQLC